MSTQVLRVPHNGNPARRIGRTLVVSVEGRLNFATSHTFVADRHPCISFSLSWPRGTRGYAREQLRLLCLALALKTVEVSLQRSEVGSRLQPASSFVP